MFLKNLDLQGFKSFAGRTKLEFHEGITAIVGPNGSGKSNVSDAVKWVLGEQSAKQLRGGKMEDVIFAGTQARKPVGFASVSITFDNSDRALPVEFDEVTVSRRVYRSGESEYRINDTACRLRDIEELFYDTGIGKEGYSMIGQGRIDKILSGRADERRELFDEAAGIVKYKRRKARAIKQLAIENDNLIRVKDILSEIESRVGPLKIQSDKAKAYLELKEELKKYDCNSFIMQSDKTGAELEALEEKINIASADFEKSNKEYESTKEEYERAEEKINELNRREEEIRLETERLNKESQELSNGTGILSEQIRALRENIKNADEDKQCISDAVPETTREARSVIDKKKNLEKSIDEFNKRQEALEGERDDLRRISETTKEKIREKREKIYAALSAQSEIKALISRLELQTESVREGIKEIQKDEGLKKDIISRHETVLNDAKRDLDRAEKQMAGALEVKEELEKRIRENSSGEAELSGQLHDMRNACVKKTSDLEALKAVTERYEGYSESIRKIMNQKDKSTGVLGAVADLFNTDSKYETAIETALGGALQNIVTDTEKQAKELVEFLKRERGGRATFLPLDAIKPKNLIKKDQFAGETGFIDIANGLVRNEEKYDILADFLLGRTLVIDNIDNALRIARKNNYSLRIVTLEGEQLNPGGSITGGAYRHAGNLLSRRRRITEAENEIIGLNKKIAAVTEKIKAHEEIKEELKVKYEVASEELVKAGIERNTASINYKNAGEKKDELAKDSTGSVERLEELKERLVALEEELKKAGKDLDNVTQEEKNLRAETEKEGELSLQNEKAAEKLAAEIEELKISYSSTLQENRYLDEQLSRLQKEKDDRERQIRFISDRQKENELELINKEKELAEAKEKFDLTDKRIESLKSEHEKTEAEREKINEKNKAFFAKREAVAETISLLDKELFRLNAAKERLEGMIESITEYMWREYELTYSYAAEFRDEDLTDLAEVKKHCEELKDEIRRLGDVNVNAIEEFKETNQRYEFLSAQHEDLVKATASLEGVINELDKGMREQFTKEFANINKEFSETFKKLFGGGNGSVTLDENADVLDADITITAQPPGKKLQNMLQLSGGERALTAIALLFAIQNLKPSPFCLLDEIEAALDDANVGRFASYLNQLADKTQYIVITHRRGTMSAADRLYGITMQEKGISTLVSVELQKAEKNAS